MWVTGLTDPLGRNIGVFLLTGLDFFMWDNCEHISTVAPVPNIHMILSNLSLLNEFKKEIFIPIKSPKWEKFAKWESVYWFGFTN